MRKVRYRIALPALLALSALTGPFVGAPCLNPVEVFTPGHAAHELFWHWRVPRALLAFWTGGGLAVCGLCFQSLLRNPLATPYTLGVASGAALGASACVALGTALPGIVPGGTLAGALAGGLAAMGVVYLLTRLKGGFSLPVILLAGVACNLFFSSLITYIQYTSHANDALRILHWLMGSLTSADTTLVPQLALWLGVGVLLLYRLHPELDLLATGEEMAASRGVDVRGVQRRVFFLASLMVGAVVAVTGPIGFVGMMAPHMCRLWLGFAHRQLLPWSFGLGGCFLVVCDALSRTLLAPAEVPIGIVTALLGGPFFLWLLMQSARSRTLF